MRIAYCTRNGVVLLVVLVVLVVVVVVVVGSCGKINPIIFCFFTARHLPLIKTNFLLLYLAGLFVCPIPACGIKLNKTENHFSPYPSSHILLPAEGWQFKVEQS
jgi:hypothetical protein